MRVVVRCPSGAGKWEAVRGVGRVSGVFPVRGFRCSELGFQGLENEPKIPYLGGGKRKKGTGEQQPPD